MRSILFCFQWALPIAAILLSTSPDSMPEDHLLKVAIPSSEQGKPLFEKHCAFCHGKKGNKGLLGAKNLQKSTLTDDQYLSIISNGKGIMPKWKKKLEEEKIKAIIQYIKTFRQ